MPANMLIERGNLRDVAQPCILGALSPGAQTLAAGGDVYAVRNASVRPMAISRLLVSAFSTSTHTDGGAHSFSFYKVTGFTAIHTGGTPAAAAAFNRKTSRWDPIPASEVACVIAGLNSGELSTATYDAPEASAPFDWYPSPPSTRVQIFNARPWVPEDGIPLVLEQNEGIIGRIDQSLSGGSGRLRLCVALQFFRF